MERTTNAVTDATTLEVFRVGVCLALPTLQFWIAGNRFHPFLTVNTRILTLEGVGCLFPLSLVNSTFSQKNPDRHSEEEEEEEEEEEGRVKDKMAKTGTNQIKSILLVQNPVIGLSPVTYSTQIQSYREQYAIFKYVNVKHNYHSPIITLDKCIRHISVAPLYIMDAKRRVQVCTCTDLYVQIHTQSIPSKHHIPVIACIWLAMTIILTGFK